MEGQLYVPKKLFMRVYFYPSYIFTAFISIILKSEHAYFIYHPLIYTLLFLVSSILYLMTKWHVKFKLLFTMNRIKKKTYRLNNQMIENFDIMNEKYFLENYKKIFIFFDGELSKIIFDEKNRFFNPFFINRLKKYIITAHEEIKSTVVTETYFIDRIQNSTFLHQLTENSNHMDIEPISFFELLIEHLTGPIFIFQIGSGILWMFDEYIYQAIISIIMTFIMEIGFVSQKYFNYSIFSKQRRTDEKYRYLNTGAELKIQTGDFQIVPCDFIILEGTATVNESILTGESIPVLKEYSSDYISKNNILYSGTELITFEKLKVLVLNTGFNTQQGSLLLKIHKREKRYENTYDSLFIISVLLTFATVLNGIIFYFTSRPLKKLIIDILLVYTNIVPPELPMELAMALNSATGTLLQKLIYVLEPWQLISAGKTDCVLFDKTGTLTEESLLLEEIIPLKKHKNYNEILGGSPILFNKSGDPFDIAIYNYLINKGIDYAGDPHKYILFDPHKKFSSVERHISKTKFTILKGAPERLLSEDQYIKYAKKGYRILVLSYKEFRMPEIPIALLLFKNSIKEESKSLIEILNNIGCKTIMVTGDMKYTSIAVANKIGMQSVNILEGEREINDFLESNSKNEIDIFSRASPEHKEKIIKYYKEQGHTTMMVGDGTNDVGALKEADVGLAILSKREDKKLETEPEVPSHIQNRKEEMDKKLRELKSKLGLIHTEKDLELGDASMAAPLSTRNNLFSILEIISTGKSVAITTLQMYKILFISSIIMGFSLGLSQMINIKFGDIQMAAISFILSLSFMAITNQTTISINKNTKKTKMPQTISKYMAFSLSYQSIINILSILSLLLKFPIEYREENKFAPSKLNMAFFILTSFLQTASFMTNYIGRPFRESITENLKLFGSLNANIFLLFILLFNINPDLTNLLECVILEFHEQIYVLGICLISLFLTFYGERIIFKKFN